MIFHSKRLTCSLCDPGDFELYYLLAGNPEVMKHITGHSISKAKATKRFKGVLSQRKISTEAGYYWIRLKAGNTFIGLIKLEYVEEGVLELGYSLLPEYWGKGYTSEIVGSVIDYIKSLPHIKKLIGIIDPENVASRSILLKFDFEFYEKGEYQGQPAEYYHLILK